MSILPPFPSTALAIISLFSKPAIIGELIIILPPFAVPVALVVIWLSRRRIKALSMSRDRLPLLPFPDSASKLPPLSRLRVLRTALKLPALPVP